MSYEHVLVNNTFLQLSAGVNTTDTALAFTTGHGIRLPVIAAPQFMYGDLVRAATGELERVKISAHSSGADAATVVRAQDGMTGLTFVAGDMLSIRVGKADWDQLPRLGLAENTLTPAGTADAITGTLGSSGLSSTTLPDDFLVFVKMTGSTGPNGITNPTFALTVGSHNTGAKTIVKGSNEALEIGDIRGADWTAILQKDASLDKWVLLNPANPLIRAEGIVRQCAQCGNIDANGQPNFLSIGTGLALNLTATATALLVAFGSGFGQHGAVDYLSRVSADVTGVVSSLAGENTSYIYADYVSRSSVTWGKTIVPPLYAPAYDRTRNSLLHFEAADASTSVIDDYGNTWSVAGNAQIDTAQFKFGTASLLLDGTGDYAESTSFLSVGLDGSWEAECYVRRNAAGTLQEIIGLTNAGGFGASMRFTAGNVLLAEFSSNGSSNDIGTITGGTAVTADATWHHVAYGYDALAGKYFAKLDGVSQGSITSASRVGAITSIRLGSTKAGGNYFNGWIDEFRLSPCSRYPNGTAFTPSASAFAVEGHWFSIQEMKMYEATAASVTAGVNPTMTARTRTFLGEADTSGAAVTAVRNYPYRGQYDSGLVSAPPGGPSSISVSHNMGLKQIRYDWYLENVLSQSGYVPGDRVKPNGTTPSAGTYFGPTTPTHDKNTVRIGSNSGANFFSIIPKAGGADVAATAANWKYGVSVRRTF